MLQFTIKLIVLPCEERTTRQQSEWNNQKILLKNKLKYIRATRKNNITAPNSDLSMILGYSQ